MYGRGIESSRWVCCEHCQLSAKRDDHYFHFRDLSRFRMTSSTLIRVTAIVDAINIFEPVDYDLHLNMKLHILHKCCRRSCTQNAAVRPYVIELGNRICSFIQWSHDFLQQARWSDTEAFFSFIPDQFLECPVRVLRSYVKNFSANEMTVSRTKCHCKVRQLSNQSNDSKGRTNVQQRYYRKWEYIFQIHVIQ